MEWSLQNRGPGVGMAVPGRSRRPPLFVRLASPVVARLPAQGATPPPQGLPAVFGRITGPPHPTPVAVFESGGRHWLAAFFGEVNWTRNLRATGQAIVTQGRSHRAVVALELWPEAAVAVRRAAVAPNASSRLAAWFVRRYVGVKLDASRTEFVAAARQHPVFELREALRFTPTTGATPSNDRRQL